YPISPIFQVLALSLSLTRCRSDCPHSSQLKLTGRNAQPPLALEAFWVSKVHDMSNPRLGLVLAEPGAFYQSGGGQNQWVEVLVDCPGVQGLFTYRLPPDLSVNPGDV